VFTQLFYKCRVLVFRVRSATGSSYSAGLDLSILSLQRLQKNEHIMCEEIEQVHPIKTSWRFRTSGFPGQNRIPVTVIGMCVSVCKPFHLGPWESLYLFPDQFIICR